MIRSESYSLRDVIETHLLSCLLSLHVKCIYTGCVDCFALRVVAFDNDLAILCIDVK